MKKIFYILSFVSLFALPSFAQDDDGKNGAQVREKMMEYIQKRLKLTISEAERFSPVFINYYNDLRKTNQQYKGDRLEHQQKIVDLRLRYRDQFKNIIGEKRSNEVFTIERDFIEEVKKLRLERMENKKNNRPNKLLKGQLP